MTRVSLLLTMTTAALGAWGPAAPPVGTYRLTTVDGQQVPMVWRRAELPDGGGVQLHWVAGGAKLKRNGRFVVTLTSLRTGVGLAGTTETLTIRGTWRVLSASRVQLRFADGRIGVWRSGEGFSRLTIEALCQDLEGQARVATMMLVRD